MAELRIAVMPERTPEQRRHANHGYCAENPYRNDPHRGEPAVHTIDEREITWVNISGRRYLEAQCKYCGKIARLGSDYLADMIESDDYQPWEGE